MGHIKSTLLYIYCTYSYIYKAYPMYVGEMLLVTVNRQSFYGGGCNTG